MNGDEVIEILDSLVSLPTRDTLETIIRAKKPVAASEIAGAMKISISEVLDHLEVLERSGLIAGINNSNGRNGKKRWYFSNPMTLQVSISNSGIAFSMVPPRMSAVERLLAFFRLRRLKKT